MWAMFAFVALVWAVVGLLIWVPLLVRATAVFAGMVIHAAITGQRPEALRGYLEAACGLYPFGFRMAFDVVHNPSSEVPLPITIRLRRVIGEMLVAAFFWFAAILVFHPAWLLPVWELVSSAWSSVQSMAVAVGVWWIAAGAGVLCLIIGLIAGASLESGHTIMWWLDDPKEAKGARRAR